MKSKKIVLRSCVITKEKLPKNELLRVNGRGAYIKKDLEVLEKAKKSKALARCLEVEISESVYESIKEEINK